MQNDKHLQLQMLRATIDTRGFSNANIEAVISFASFGFRAKVLRMRKVWYVKVGKRKVEGRVGGTTTRPANERWRRHRR